jgi:hypothetical protein
MRFAAVLLAVGAAVSVVGAGGVAAQEARPKKAEPKKAEAKKTEPNKNDAHRLRDMAALKTALARYFKDNAAYPPAPAGSGCKTANYNNVGNLAAALVPKYLASIPRDPSPRACEYNYLYAVSADRRQYVLLINLEDIDRSVHPDLWCIGTSSGGVVPGFTAYRRCPGAL